MEISYTPEALQDIRFWKKSGNKIIQKRISQLLDDIELHPYTGIGKPEPLKYELTGYWSRRINDEHRIVYKVVGDNLTVVSLRFHY